MTIYKYKDRYYQFKGGSSNWSIPPEQLQHMVEAYDNRDGKDKDKDLIEFIDNYSVDIYEVDIEEL